jgi:predicted amidohydrolase YtcJ
MDEYSADPKGGKFGRDPETGRLTGQILEAALYRFGLEGLTREPMIVPPFDRDVRKKALMDAAGILNAAGVTGIHDAVVSPSYVTSYLDLGGKSLLPLRVNMLIPYIFLPELEKLGLVGNWGNEWVRCTGLKIIVDGAIAGRTAALRDGYSHDPDNHGILLFDDRDELDNLAKRIHCMGYQACLHANGDLAIDMALDAIEKAQADYPRLDPRHRIEHCTIINESILRRMRALGVMATPFGSYIWQHGDKLVKYYGRNRAEAMFGHRSFLEGGVRVAGASDHPAGLHPPLLGVQSMVTRKTASGRVIGPGQKISIEEAFKMYTAYAAYASFEENIKGSLTVGRLADIVVLDRDPWTITPGDIGQIGVDMTILGGNVVYREEQRESSEKPVFAL